MTISASRSRGPVAAIHSHFDAQTINGSSSDVITRMASITARSAWSPIIFRDGRRDAEHFQKAGFIVFDVDNRPGEPGCSLNEALTIFNDYCGYIQTSKSHQKEKRSGKEIIPPDDRFHVILFLKEEVTSASRFRALALSICERFPFFDKAAALPSQFFFPGGEGAEYYALNGERHIDDVFRITTGTPVSQVTPAATTVAIKSAGLPPEAIMAIMAGLGVAGSKGAFSSYREWVSLGCAIKRVGLGLDVWQASSWPEAASTCEKKWATFTIARDGAPESGMGTIIRALRRHAPVEYLDFLQATKDNGYKFLACDALTTREELYSIPDKDSLEIIPESNRKPARNGGSNDPIPSFDTIRIIMSRDNILARVVRNDEFTSALQYDSSFNGELDVETGIILRFSRYGIELNQGQVRFIWNYLKTDEEHKTNSVLDFLAKCQNKHDDPWAEIMSYWQFDTVSNAADPSITDRRYAAPVDDEKRKKDAAEIFRTLYKKLAMRLYFLYVARDHKKASNVDIDICPILIGKQGTYKSTFCKHLGLMEYWTNVSPPHGGILGEEYRKLLLGKMVVELPELAALNKSEVEDIKAFISCGEMSVRKKYSDTVMISLPRTFFAIGTTNSEYFLKDKTGARRFFPIPLHKINPELFKHTDLFESAWAEAWESARVAIESKETQVAISHDLVESARKAAESVTVESTIITTIKRVIETMEHEPGNLVREKTGPGRVFISKEAIIDRVRSDGSTRLPGGGIKGEIKTAMRELGYIDGARRSVRVRGAPKTLCGWEISRIDPRYLARESSTIPIGELYTDIEDEPLPQVIGMLG